ncbi:MAG: barstar family protein [Candidatus Moranbacteria bacterium]|jgi:RNAse (barnase) inhibitor barstar|nr:barstar family protein [Candidatus Moranbacteria bacterium]
MRQYVLDGQNMTTLEAAYDELEQIFALPEYFGRNLDALEECLADLAHQEGSLEVTIEHANIVEAELPEWEMLLEVLLGNPYIAVLSE